MLKHLVIGIAALLLAASPARAEFVNENLLVTMPPGFKVGHQAKNNMAMISELIPSGETIETWTEMVTVQIFYKLNVKPEQFRARMDENLVKWCPGAKPSSTINQTPENGYPSALWVMICPKNPKTDKPEVTWVKGMQGRDSFYVVQKATKFMPTNESLPALIAYFKRVSVCDSRQPEQKCPGN